MIVARQRAHWTSPEAQKRMSGSERRRCSHMRMRLAEIAWRRALPRRPKGAEDEVEAGMLGLRERKRKEKGLDGL